MNGKGWTGNGSLKLVYIFAGFQLIVKLTRLAQSVERQPFKLVVEGSSPSSGDHSFSSAF
eukprot:scaffold521_cov177-Ochromonas_danica.AAC.21